MRIFEWNNKTVTEADLFIKLEKSEMETMKALFPEITKAQNQFDDSGFVFVNTTNKTITPLNELSLAFGGQYNGYSPYGGEVETEVDFNELTWVPYTEYEEGRMKKRKRG